MPLQWGGSVFFILLLLHSLAERVTFVPNKKQKPCHDSMPHSLLLCYFLLQCSLKDILSEVIAQFYHPMHVILLKRLRPTPCRAAVPATRAAVWLPNILYTIIAIYLYRKAPK